MEIEVDEGEPDHVGRYVVADDVVHEPGLVGGLESVAGSLFGAGRADVLPGRDEEARCAAGGIENGLVLLGIDNLDHEVDDVPRRAELSRVALAPEHRQEVLEGVAQALGVVVLELSYGLQE